MRRILIVFTMLWFCGSVLPQAQDIAEILARMKAMKNVSKRSKQK